MQTDTLEAALDAILRMPVPEGKVRRSDTLERIQKIADKVQRAIDAGWPPTRLAKELKKNGEGASVVALRKAIQEVCAIGTRGRGRKGRGRHAVQRAQDTTAQADIRPEVAPTDKPDIQSSITVAKPHLGMRRP